MLSPGWAQRSRGCCAHMRGRCPAGSWQIPWPPDWNAPCPLQPGPAPEGSWLPHHFSDAGEIIPAGLRVRTPVFHPELNLRSVIRARWSAFVRCYLLLFKMGFTEPSPRGVGLCENRLRPLRAEPVPGAVTTSLRRGLGVSQHLPGWPPLPNPPSPSFSSLLASSHLVPCEQPPHCPRSFHPHF